MAAALALNEGNASTRLNPNPAAAGTCMLVVVRGGAIIAQLVQGRSKREAGEQIKISVNPTDWREVWPPPAIDGGAPLFNAIVKGMSGAPSWLAAQGHGLVGC